MIRHLCASILILSLGACAEDAKRSWAADNGNGAYSNPLFYDEFSDPDMIRVGPDFRLEGGKDVNRFGLHVSRASNPRGPWKHNRIEQPLHDLSVLFDDGKICAVYGAGELNPDLTAVVPGTLRKSTR